MVQAGAEGYTIPAGAYYFEDLPLVIYRARHWALGTDGGGECRARRSVKFGVAHGALLWPRLIEPP